jgi:hypothetical protein
MTVDEMMLIHRLTAKAASHMGFRMTGHIRAGEDGEEAVQHVFVRMVSRAEKHWDRSLPLEPYIAAAVGKELKKFRERERRQEIPVPQGEQV